MKRGWFGPKMIGWGASPRTWQGWLVTVVALVGMAASVRFLAPIAAEATGWPRPAITFGFAIAWIGALLGVIALTYDRER